MPIDFIPLFGAILLSAGALSQTHAEAGSPTCRAEVVFRLTNLFGEPLPEKFLSGSKSCMIKIQYGKKQWEARPTETIRSGCGQHEFLIFVPFMHYESVKADLHEGFR